MRWRYFTLPPFFEAYLEWTNPGETGWHCAFQRSGWDIRGGRLIIQISRKVTKEIDYNEQAYKRNS